jgi:hypothetical protein
MTTIKRIMTIADMHIFEVYTSGAVECFRTVECIREGGRTTKDTKEFVTYAEAENYVKAQAARKTTLEAVMRMQLYLEQKRKELAWKLNNSGNPISYQYEQQRHLESPGSQARIRNV